MRLRKGKGMYLLPLSTGIRGKKKLGGIGKEDDWKKGRRSRK